MACHAHPSPDDLAAASAAAKLPSTTSEDEVLRPLSAEVVATLVANHREFLNFLLRRIDDRALAEDLLQEAFVRGLDRIESLRDGESVVAWFYRSLRNAVIDHYRRRGAQSRRLEKLVQELEPATEPDGEFAEQVCKCVARLAETLKPEYAAALQRIEIDGLSVQAFAQESGVTAGNAAVRVFRARQALRKQVAVTCGTCADHGCLDCQCGAPSSPDALG